MATLPVHRGTANYLRKVAISEEWAGWETLFQDPRDGRFWERTFPQGEMQGAGPPRLDVISSSEAHKKYKF